MRLEGEEGYNCTHWTQNRDEGSRHETIRAVVTPGMGKRGRDQHCPLEWFSITQSIAVTPRDCYCQVHPPPVVSNYEAVATGGCWNWSVLEHGGADRVSREGR